jgi:hypothetical protein
MVVVLDKDNAIPPEVGLIELSPIAVFLPVPPLPPRPIMNPLLIIFTVSVDAPP